MMGGGRELSHFNLLFIQKQQQQLEVREQLMHRLAVVALIKLRKNKNKIRPMSQSAQHDTIG